MGDTCGYIEEEKILPFWWKNLKQINYSEDLGIDKILILKEIQKIRWKCVEWMYLPINKKKWRALVNMAMSNRVPENVRNFLTS
jgi:hypothetical protein